MSEQLDIVVTSMDVGASEAAKRLAQAFDLSAREAEQFVRELPRVAKRNATREEAARYVEALRAIGARVETLASEAPRPTLRARMPSSPDQLIIDPAPESQPAMRFRATGNLGMISVPPDEVLHPSIPKAPLIPRDLNRMPNGAQLPMPSIRPPAIDEDDGSGEHRRHTDAQLPPPLVLAAREAALGTRSDPAESARSGNASSQPAPTAPPSLRGAPTERAGAATRGSGKALVLAAVLVAIAIAIARWLA